MASTWDLWTPTPGLKTPLQQTKLRATATPRPPPLAAFLTHDVRSQLKRDPENYFMGSKLVKAQSAPCS